MSTEERVVVPFMVVVARLLAPLWTLELLVEGYLAWLTFHQLSHFTSPYRLI
jgi:hypothetical protein